MTTIKRYTTSNSSNSESGSNTYPKGSMSNPYTVAEYEAIPDEEWKGGYVEGMGYVRPIFEVIGSYPSNAFSDNYSDWLSDWNWGEYSHPFSHMGSAPEPGGGGGNGGNNQNPNTPKPDGEGGTGGNTQDPNAPKPDNSTGGEDKPIGYKEGFRYYFKDGKLEKVLDNTIGYDSISVNGMQYPMNGTITPVENADPKYGSQYITTFQIYQILADHSDVEWAISFNDDEDKQAYINTTNLHSNVEFHEVAGYTCMAHSHPEGTDLSDPDLAFYAQMLSASFIDKSNQYQKFYLYRNGHLEDKTEAIWEYARNHKKKTRYKEYADKDPYK